MFNMMGLVTSSNRVNVASVGGSTDPTDITGLHLWFDITDVLSGAEPSADAPIGGAGALWQDKSGNGWDASQSTGIKQPLYKTNIQNGLPAILFDGTDDFLQVISDSINQPYTVIMVGRPTDIEPQHIWLSNRPNASDMIVYEATDFYMRSFTLQDTGFNLVQDTNYKIIMTFDGASSLCRLNGADSATLSPGTNLLYNINIGSGATGSQNFAGYIFEIIVYAKVLNPTEVGQIETYLNTKWGL